MAAPKDPIQLGALPQEVAQADKARCETAPDEEKKNSPAGLEPALASS